jgi:hypothetical protein
LADVTTLRFWLWLRLWLTLLATGLADVAAICFWFWLGLGFWCRLSLATRLSDVTAICFGFWHCLWHCLSATGLADMAAVGLRFRDTLDFATWLADVTTVCFTESVGRWVGNGKGVDCGCENEDADRVDEFHLEGVCLFVCLWFV